MRVLVFAATSAMAKPLCRHHAAQGHRMCLVGRDDDKLARLAQDLTVRGAGAVETVVADLACPERADTLIEQLWQAEDPPQRAYFFQGALPDQSQCQQSVDDTLASFQVNALGVIALLTPLAQRMETAGRGALVVVSSVAGDRGRQSNYVYGSAKALLNTFLQGLRHRLAPAGVQVITIKPGFVDTPMTAHLDKGPLWAQPEQVAEGIIKATERGRSEVYLPGYWRGIMAVIRALPQPLFNRLKL
ncbi:SDR family oxidoreductase [Ferrimonas balearica]|uniref:SDR family oxidoreductase n=1 Tax=Ferrimonas balearica TaxID=44012 RepID=UPI001C993C27|nr:SDR family oxidoreductase [Ferrimonas balearica]MBY5991866.1 SDR family oxidoreductase [Ferrimonas balearica]